MDKHDPAEEQDKQDAHTNARVQKEEPSKPSNAVTRLYDKIPLTYRQVDLLVKVLIAALVIVLVIAVATGSGIQI